MSSGRTRIELRQCACESTIALRVSGDGRLIGESGAGPSDLIPRAGDDGERSAHEIAKVRRSRGAS